MATEVPPITPRRRRLRRNFRLLAVAFPFALILIANVICWWLGYGLDTSLVMRSVRSADQSVAHLNPRVDAAYCREDLRGPEPRGFQLPKPANHVRVFVAGESSVQGFPYPSELSFPRQLECILQGQIPGKTIEVLNAGIVGISSAPLADVVSQLTTAEADAIVIYAGHNEFYGVGGVATNAPASRLSIAIRQYRLGHILSSLMEPSPKPADDRFLLERLPADYSISVSSPLIAAANEEFGKNIRRIITTCRRHKIPLLLCTVVSNVRGQSPHPFGSTTPEQQRMLSQAEQAAAEVDFVRAVETVNGAIELFPEDAVLQYRRAQYLEKLNRHEDAAQAFRAARDLDPCRYRAPDSFRQLLMQVAKEEPGDHSVLDLVPLFDNAANQGESFFLEHVHFTLDGHWFVAQAIAQALVETTWNMNFNEAMLPTEAERDRFLGLISTDYFSGDYLALSLQNSVPLNSAVDHDLHAQILEERIAARLNVNDDDLQLFMRLSNAAKMDDPVDGMGRLCLDQRQLERAAEFFERSRRRRPWMPNGFVFGAVCSQLLGDSANATELLKQSESTVVPESPRLLRDKQRLLNSMQSSPR